MARQDSARQDGPGALVWTLPEPPRSRGPGLSRERILRAALVVADAEGLRATTMRRVASEVGASTPMSLYRYVGSKDGLADLMIDAVYAEVETPEAPSGDWRSDLRLLGIRTWDAASRHPWWAELWHTRPPIGPNSLRCSEFGLAALDGLGLDLGSMMTYLSMVNGHVVGSALQVAEEQKMRQRSGLHTEDDLREAAQSFRDGIVGDGRYPTFARWLEADMPYAVDEEAAFAVGLDILLDGIAARLR